MKLMQPRFNLKFYELFQHPAKKTMLRYAEILKLKPLSFSDAAALLLLLVSRLTSKSTCQQQNTMPLKDEQVPEFHGKLLVSSRFTTKSTCRQQNTMPLKDEQVLEFHGKMPNVTSETVEKTLLLLLATCYLLPATCAPKAAEHKHQKQLAALLLLLVSRLTTKSTCRQQNTMPLKDDQVPELRGKMPNVTSETVEKTIVFEGFPATAGCYCYLLPAIVHQKQLPTTTYPTSYSYLWTTTSNKSTCRQQNTMPLKDEHHQKHLPTAKHHATEERTSPRIAQKDA